MTSTDDTSDQLPRTASPTAPARAAAALRKETTGGALLLLAAALAVLWANSPWAASYVRLGQVRVGPAALDLDLALDTWAADGLLAVFFFVAGLELKREFVDGDLGPAPRSCPGRGCRRRSARPRLPLHAGERGRQR